MLLRDKLTSRQTTGKISYGTDDRTSAKAEADDMQINFRSRPTPDRRSGTSERLLVALPDTGGFLK